MKSQEDQDRNREIRQEQNGLQHQLSQTSLSVAGLGHLQKDAGQNPSLQGPAEETGRHQDHLKEKFMLLMD